MRTENAVVLVGNLANRPQHLVTSGQVDRVRFDLAVSRRYYNQSRDAWDERLDGYFPVVVWRQTARHVWQSLDKGMRVVVLGRVIRRSYKNDKGDTNWITEVEADEVCPSLRWQPAQVLEPTGDADAAASDQPQPTTDAAPAKDAAADGIPEERAAVGAPF